MDDDLDQEGLFFPFHKAAKCKPGEMMLFPYIVYKNRKHRDEMNKLVMVDARMDKMQPEQMKTPIFDHKCMAYGGFESNVAKGM